MLPWACIVNESYVFRVEVTDEPAPYSLKDDV